MKLRLQLVFFVLFWFSGYCQASDRQCDSDVLKGEWRKGTESREESEFFLTNELRVKLEQFQDCLDQQAQSSSDSSSEANKTNSGEGGSGAGGQGVNLASAEAGAQQSETQQFSENRKSSSASQGLDKSVASTDSTRKMLRVEEDSVARLLREAYEKEVEPERRAALAAEYEKHTGASIE